MGENPLENQRYSEEEALEEAERLREIVKAGEGQRSYSDAERWMKITKQEVRPFDEKKFIELKDALNYFLIRLYQITSEEGKKHVREDLAKILDNKNIFLRAYEYADYSLLFDIEKMILAGEDEEDDDTGEILKKLKEFGLNLLVELSPKIVEDLHKGRINNSWLSVLGMLVSKGDENAQKAGVNALTEVIDILEKRHDISLIGSILANGSEEQMRKAMESIRRLSEEMKDSPELAYLVSYFFKRESNPELMTEGQKVLESILERYDLPFEITYDWLRSGLGTAGVVKLNLSSIIELENKKPGSAKFLYKEFSIADFGRYPVNLLLKQCEEADNLKNSYGVVVFPRDDWNGAFYSTGAALESLLEGLEGRDFSLRVFECEGKIGVARALLKLNKKYNPPDGSGHKISLAIIGGHGTENSIQFGGGGEANSLYLNDLMGKGVQRTSQFFEDNPTIILASCSTGADKGIGQKLSEVMGARVIAPKEPTNILEFKVSKNLKVKPRFNAVYAKDDTKSIFVGGEKRGAA